MIAVISTTFDDQYLFYLPITVWSWNKIGVKPLCIIPINVDWKNKMHLIGDTILRNSLSAMFTWIGAVTNKEATYTQCSRLYAAAVREIEDNEILITSDIDMAVFNREYFDQAQDGTIHVFGTDLVPDNQYPICYISMPAKTWREVMWIGEKDTVQSKLDNLLGHLECEHFRGNYWAKDQETIYNHLIFYPITKHFRANVPHQFATRRADRDGWPTQISSDIIDAHLPRPGYTEENFGKILNLFQTMYPNEDFQWMIDYRNEYIKLMK